MTPTPVRGSANPGPSSRRPTAEATAPFAPEHVPGPTTSAAPSTKRKSKTIEIPITVTELRGSMADRPAVEGRLPERPTADVTAVPYVLTAESPDVIDLSTDTAHLCAWSGQVNGVWRDRHLATAFRLDPQGIHVPVCDEHAPLLTDK